MTIDGGFVWVFFKYGGNERLRFHIHPVIQTAELHVTDRKFPGLERMPERFLWTEEWYEFGPENIKGLNYILGVDEKSYDPKVNWGTKAV